MESLELRIFKEVAYTKSITKAAENLGYVQSNVTSHIRKLEEELGTRLLVRSNKGVSLTMEGEYLLSQAEQIIALLDETCQYFHKEFSSLRIGAVQTVASYLLPDILMKYQEIHPNTLIAVHTLSQADFPSYMAAGQLDCVITNSSQAIPHARQIFEYPQELAIITPVSCASLQDAGQYCVVVNTLASCPYREALLNWWNKNIIKPPHILVTDTLDSLFNMVKSGAGISLLPMAIAKDKEGIGIYRTKDIPYASIRMWAGKNRQSDEVQLLELMMRNSLTKGTTAMAASLEV